MTAADRPAADLPPAGPDLTGRDPGRVLVARVREFGAELRAAGVAVTTDRLQTLLAALAGLGPEQLYRAGRLTLCASPDDLARYDQVWAARGGAPVPRPRPASRPRSVVSLLATATAGPPPEPSDQDGSQLAVRGSPEERLRHRDLAELTDPERAEVRALLALLAPAVPTRPARRTRPSPRGRVDPPRSFRAILRGWGEPAQLARRRVGQRARRLVLLLDVSGSMAPYADPLLRFAHAAVRRRPADTEVFTIGTRLTRVTAALRLTDPQAALRAAGERVPDWQGGTRLGESLRAFLRGYGHRGTARGAVVVVCSDGWECGEPAELAQSAAWLARLAHRVLWVTPHAGRPGFAPTAAGLAAVLPHLDGLLAGHSLAALADLAEWIGAC